MIKVHVDSRLSHMEWVEGIFLQTDLEVILK